MRPSLGLSLCAAAVLFGCSPANQAPSGTLRVMAAETFLADIAQNVAGDQLVVDSLLSPGINPHEFQSTPQDAIRLAQAQVLIINGLGYDAWLERSLGSTPGGPRIVEASSGLEPGPLADPHLWMNPRNAARYAENIRDALSEADPPGSRVYAANAEVYLAELRTLDDWIQSQVELIPAGRRVLITNHYALESFAQAYGFQVAAVVIPGVTSEAAPSAQQMAAVIQAIQAVQAPAIFLDVHERADLAQQIAAESGARVVTGLYVETLSDAGGPAPTYIEMMKHDVGLIVQALR